MDKKQGWAEFSRRLNEPPEMTDTLIRHKWPEETPEKDGQYLIRIVAPSGLVNHHLRVYEDGKWGAFENYITHWWELPEVTE